MSATVYTTAGGRRFHADLACRALESGRNLSDADCGCDEFCHHRMPVSHLPCKRTAEDAARASYTACRVCVPTAHALPATGETFGHEPFGPYDGVLICRRCYTDRRGRRRVVPWPCTSAAILGLVTLDADRWNARYPVGTPVLAWPWTRADEPLRTRTRTPAWRLGHGDSVVSVDGYAGGICLTHIDPQAGARA